MTHTPPTTDRRVMSCSDCEAQLFDHVHDELAPAMSVRVARHLATCAGCALSFCELRCELHEIVDAQLEPPPKALEERLRASVARRFGPPWYQRVGGESRPWLLAALLVATLLPAGWWWMQRTPSRTGPDAGPHAGPHATQDRGARLDGYDASRPLGAAAVIF